MGSEADSNKVIINGTPSRYFVCTVIVGMGPYPEIKKPKMIKNSSVVTLIVP